MSKIYQEYLRLKSIDDETLYLFRCGKFYIFLSEDCDKINEYVVLKKTLFTKEIYKCGFPSNVLQDYLKVFQNHKLKIEVIEQVEEQEHDVAMLLKKLDIDNMTPLEALCKLKELKEYVK